MRLLVVNIMRIGNVQTLEQSVLGSANPEIKGAPWGQALMFQRVISDLTAEQYQRHMAGLLQKIDEQGTKLGQKADIKELQKYRELISEFMGEIVSNSYAFHKENSYEARRRHKVLATVTKVNEKLEELAKEILAAQQDNLAILNKVDDIRGLILDIMM